MRDYLMGASKVKSIMDNRTTFLCRQCGLAYSKFNQADRCCQKQARNKSGQFAQGWRN